MRSDRRRPEVEGSDPAGFGVLSSISRDRLCAWLILARVPGLGPVTATRLVEHLGDPLRVLAAGRSDLQSLGIKAPLVDAILSPEESAAEADLAWAEAEGVHILTRDAPSYPSRLAQIPAPPILLFVRGDPQILQDPMLAIVGSRNPTASGRETTSELARDLAACGLTIASGLALGIDGSAHQGAEAQTADDAITTRKVASDRGTAR